MIIEHGVLGPGFRPATSAEDAVATARTGGGVAWIRLRDPDDAELAAALTAVGRDRATLAVARRRRDRAGFIALRDHLLITLLVVDDRAEGAPTTLQAVVGADHLLLVQNGGDAGTAAGLRTDTEQRLGEIAAQLPARRTGWVVLAGLLFVLCDGYDEALDGIEDAVDAINYRLFPRPDDTLVEDTYRTHQRIMRAGRAVRPLAHGLAEADDVLVADPDLRRGVLRLRTVVEDLVERVTWAEQTVDSLVDTQLGLTAQRTNELSTRQAAVAQRISAYALLFAIPNGLFALYGANFEHLPRILTADYGYPVLLGITVVLMVVAAWRLRRNGWL
jgi:magnesium transporter